MFSLNLDKNADSFRFLAQANNVSEWMWKIYFWCMICIFFGTLTIYMSFVLYCWLTHGRIIIDHLYRPFKVMLVILLYRTQNLSEWIETFFCVLYSLPWNQNTPFGYVGESSFVIASAEAFCIGNGSTFLLFISICIHHHAFYKIYKYSINKCKNNGNHCDEKLLCNLIRFHISIKE